MDTFFPKYCTSSNEKNISEQNNSQSLNDRKNLHLCQHSQNCKICTVTGNNLNSNTVKVKRLLDIHHKVTDSGLPNFLGCKIPVNEFQLQLKCVIFWNLVFL